MEFTEIIYAKENRVATITLNRPAKLNAYSEVMVHEIIAALNDARDDDEIRAVIITGTGRGFCSGGDISRDFQYPARYRGHKMEAMLEMRENMHQLVTLLDRFDKPVIAAVNGAAVAGGLTLALSCDFRIAAESAKLGDTSLKFSLIPDEGGAYLFPKFMGLERMVDFLQHRRRQAVAGHADDGVEVMSVGAKGSPLGRGKFDHDVRRNVENRCWKRIDLRGDSRDFREIPPGDFPSRSSISSTH